MPLFNNTKLKLSELEHQSNLITNDVGDFIFMNNKNLKRFQIDTLEDLETEWLKQAGIGCADRDTFFYNAHQFKKALRNSPQKKLNYLIIVPTLRCNLRCAYCQVSRADEKAKGYDWTPEIIDKFVEYVDQHTADNVKIEFQGGEPSLRLDIVLEIVERVKRVKSLASFVICTNLSKLSPDLLSLLKRNDFTISSSLDGPPKIHQANRTISDTETNKFFDNLDLILDQFGPTKISLLPTISDYKSITDIIDFFFEKKLSDIFLRPVNFQGFARKKFADISQGATDWLKVYFNALDYIAEKNQLGGHQLIEAGLSIHLNRIFKPQSHNYVDLRNPNFLGKDYLVVDYDGKFYPTDEARMLSRIGLVDLEIGNIFEGLNEQKIDLLNSRSSNAGDPACKECSFQPFCGVDNIDNISRYGTIDVQTLNSHYCITHMGIFKYIFNKLSSRNESFGNMASLCLTGQKGVSAIFGGHHFD